MGLFRRKVPSHLVRIHPDNAKSKDWVILLEAGTIIGPSPERLRVARATQERKLQRNTMFGFQKPDDPWQVWQVDDTRNEIVDEDERGTCCRRLLGQQIPGCVNKGSQNYEG